MRILVNDLPKALTVDLMKEAATGGGYQAGQETSRSGAQTLPPCLARAESNIWTSLQGRKDFHSRCRACQGRGNIRDWVVELGHDGCPGMTVAKRIIRTRLWFPGMDDRVERGVGACLDGQASTKVSRRDPLKPSPPPEEPWQELPANHKYLLVVVTG